MSNLNEILTGIGITSLETLEIPGRPPTFLPVPENLNFYVRNRLTEQFPNGLYSHQALAIDVALGGTDVCLATSTASGKSAVFAAVASHHALEDPQALTIAMYPARALVQDQLQKWQEFAAPLRLHVGQIDGSVPVADRMRILRDSQVVVMTPDVIHAWLLNRIADTAPELQRLRLIVLDEAHSYNGVFGTNMAYLFRRLSVLASPFQVIASTATIGEPLEFLQKLTGREMSLFEKSTEGSQVPEKRVVLTQLSNRGSFETLANLLRQLAASYEGRFLAFADSRKVVERLTAAATRRQEARDLPSDFDIQTEEPELTIPGVLMPYRAGYETNDRTEIQNALATGQLKGVVSTSALELGVDIGDIDLVILLNTPPSIQAFWQRFGRAGRRNRPGECLLIDDTGMIARHPNRLTNYLTLPPERNYLYLANRYVQYTNALCAAREIQEGGIEMHIWDSITGLPESFLPMLTNEVNPTEIVPDDLYPLKQRGENGPHHEFPLRGGIEANFQVKKHDDTDLGTLSMAQLVREAYPGAIYYYRASPYRIQETRMNERLLRATGDRFITTQPNAQITVFPNFASGGKCWTSPEGFLMECNLQVAERVMGFTERRGSSVQAHNYGLGSRWSQRPVQRFFKTTGVVWCFANNGVIPEATTRYIMDAFCLTEGVHSRDIGFGRFSSNVSPRGTGECRGLCIYDDVVGGLRLTERLTERFGEILETAVLLAETEGNATAAFDLEALKHHSAHLSSPQSLVAAPGLATSTNDWVTVIAPGQSAVLVMPAETREVTILRFVYTPTGLKYRLTYPRESVEWTVEQGAVAPIHGITRMIRYNVNTGEQEEASDL